ncbi:MAG: universal stress protein [Bacteroidales bacterium]|jgi:nucleotide-binding universal stress UspA family protein|nr:universal stress protein [Bacteroidales bacterium]
MDGYKIIVAYDFQELSDAALKQAYKLANFVNGNILLLVVMDSDLLTLTNVFNNAHAEKLKQKITETMHEEITERLEQFTRKATEESGIQVGFRVTTGRIYECILNIAAEETPRFIVMGRTSVRSSVTRFGSNTMRVVEKSNCPVITIPDITSCSDFGNIVLPIDLTKQTREEVFNAISFGLFFDATIHLVSVVMGGISAKKSRIYSKMQKMKKLIEENGVRCTEKLFKKSHHPIHEAILAYVDELHADTLMIMTHQEISTSDKYIGAVAHQIIHESSVPVISLTSVASKDRQSEKARFWFNKLFSSKEI